MFYKAEGKQVDVVVTYMRLKHLCCFLTVGAMSSYKPVFLQRAGLSGKPRLHGGPLALQRRFPLGALGRRQGGKAAQLCCRGRKQEGNRTLATASAG